MHRWLTRDGIRGLLIMDSAVLLYKNGYPSEWYEEVVEKGLE